MKELNNIFEQAEIIKEKEKALQSQHVELLKKSMDEIKFMLEAAKNDKK